jgi:hypothetical protein
MAEPVPAAFTKGLSSRETDAIRIWWQGLDAEARRTLKRRGAKPRLVLLGRFVDAEPGDEASAEPCDFYEYLVAHELSLDDGRRFHICRAHDRARRALSEGRLRADFACPLDRDDCPMRKLLDQRVGSDLLLSLAPPEGGKK